MLIFLENVLFVYFKKKKLEQGCYKKTTLNF